MKPITKIALGVLATSIALLAFLPGNTPDRLAEAQSAVQPSVRADVAPTTQAAPAGMPARLDADALARETLTFVDGALEDLRRGAAAGDARGISDRVEWPAIRLIGRWQDLPADQRQAHAACFDALDAVRILAIDITARSESLARRESLETGAAATDRALKQCRANP